MDYSRSLSCNVFIALLIGFGLVLSACSAGAPYVPPGGQVQEKPNAWTNASGDDTPVVQEYAPQPGDVPAGYDLLDSFILTRAGGGSFSAAVQVTIVLSTPVTPGTRVYLYRIYDTGQIIPASSGIVGEDGRTIVFTLISDGRYLILIHHEQLTEATTFIAWAFADYARGAAPLEVNFSAFQERGILPVLYHWDFGDGTTGEGQSASHTYLEVQDYDVVITATDGGGRLASYTSTHITVTTGIEPLAVAVQKPVATGNPREFKFYSTVTGGLAPLTYFWDFGDGTTSSEENPVHQYAQTGIYEITLTVTDARGEVVKKQASIEDLRTALLSATPAAGPRDLSVVFTVAVDGDKQLPTRITLDYADGAPLVLKDYGTPPAVDVNGDYPHMYSIVSVYPAVLTVSTQFKGNTYTLTSNLAIDVGPAIPVINQVSPTLIFKGDTLTINGGYFEDAQATGRVIIGFVTSAVVTWSDTVITVRVPNTIPFGLNDVYVENRFGFASSPAQITVDIPSPYIVTMNPTRGTARKQVTLAGYYFGDGSTGVLNWNGTPLAADSWADGQIVFTVPADTSDGVVTVVRDGKTSNAMNFKVVPDAPDWGGGGPGQL